MKNKKTVWICVAVLVLLALGIFIWKSCSSEAPKSEEQEPGQSEENVRTGEALQGTDTEKTEVTDEAEQTQDESAHIIESEGNLIITIPDDEESDGF